MFGHRIPLGETDAFSTPPSIGDVFKCSEIRAVRSTRTSLKKCYESNTLFLSLSRQTRCLRIRDRNGSLLMLTVCASFRFSIP